MENEQFETPDKQPYCIYHDDLDGKVAATAFIKKYPLGITIKMSHGYDLIKFHSILDKIPEGSVLFMLDFSFKNEDEYMKLYEKKISTYVIDHHEGAYDLLSKLNNTNKISNYTFNNNHCGAYLAYQHFFPNLPQPEVIKYVEDGDLWTEKYGITTGGVTAYLNQFSGPFTLLDFIEDTPIHDIIGYGAILIGYKKSLISKIKSQLDHRYVNVKGMKVKAYNSNIFKSELGNELAEIENEPVIIYNINGDKVHISIRSIEGHQITANDIALRLGGNGHKHASGCVLPFEIFKELLQ